MMPNIYIVLHQIFRKIVTPGALLKLVCKISMLSTTLLRSPRLKRFSTHSSPANTLLQPLTLESKMFQPSSTEPISNKYEQIEKHLQRQQPTSNIGATPALFPIILPPLSGPAPGGRSSPHIYMNNPRPGAFLLFRNECTTQGRTKNPGASKLEPISKGYVESLAARMARAYQLVVFVEFHVCKANYASYYDVQAFLRFSL